MARRKIGFWYRLVVMIVKPVLLLFTKHQWRGLENIPAEGGFVTAVNHISYVDPLTYAHFQYDSGREPHFLAKASLFRIPFVGRAITGAGQIPVYRDSADAALAFRAAVQAIENGACVAVYPEGTITRDKALWPMRGKTGAARIALTTGAPVIPVAQWGAHELLPPYGKRLRLLPRKRMTVVAGPPVNLDEFRGRDLTAEVLRGATDRIMDAITALLAEIRGEQPPPPVRKGRDADGARRSATPSDGETAAQPQPQAEPEPQPEPQPECKTGAVPGQQPSDPVQQPAGTAAQPVVAEDAEGGRA